MIRKTNFNKLLWLVTLKDSQKKFNILSLNLLESWMRLVKASVTARRNNNNNTQYRYHSGRYASWLRKGHAIEKAFPTSCWLDNQTILSFNQFVECFFLVVNKIFNMIIIAIILKRNMQDNKQKTSFHDNIHHNIPRGTLSSEPNLDRILRLSIETAPGSSFCLVLLEPR